MSFTDQKPRIATKDDVRGRWALGKPGERFRCYLCGHRIAEGETWRWVFGGNRGVINFITCEKCDGPDVLDRFAAAMNECKTRFWWVYEERI